MSDSEELLFGDITDAEADPSQSNDNDNNHNHNRDGGHNGTSYPQYLTTVAMDSDSDSDSSDDLHRNPSHSTEAIQIKNKSNSKSSLFRKNRSRKKIKDIVYKETATNNNHQTTAGELDTHQDHDDIDLVEIDPSSPINSNNNIISHKKKKKKVSFLNGKSHKNHHIISDKDSEDEDDMDDDLITSPTSNQSCFEKTQFVGYTLKENGHLPSIILTVIVIITIFGCFSGHIVAIIVFVICYLVYLIECYINKTWKEMNTKETANATVKLLDTLRKTPPVIDWYVECYHYETNIIPPTERKTIVWVHGKPENGGHRFEELGFDIKYFKWDWNGINFVAEKDNQHQICAIILPDGYEGNRIQKSMVEKLKNQNLNRNNTDDDHEDDEKVAIQVHDDEDVDDIEDNDEDGDEYKQSVLDMNGPIFFRWNGNIEELIEDFKEKGVIHEDRKKVITHKNSRIYDYREWNDISIDYPDFNRYEITKLNITKTYCLLNNETRSDYNEQKQAFLDDNNKDEYQSFNESINMLGFKNCLTIQKYDDRKGDMNKTPFWYTIHGYWIYSVLLCTLYPRYKSSTMFGKTNWKIIKAITI